MTHRLCRVPHRSPGTAGLWVWRDDDVLDLTCHLDRRTLPAGSGRAEFWRLTGELHAERLDRSRPMWSAYLIDGLADCRVVFYVKVHHICEPDTTSRSSSVPGLRDERYWNGAHVEGARYRTLVSLTEHCLAELESAVSAGAVQAEPPAR